MASCLLCVVAFSLAALPAFGQAPATPPAFDVASIRRARPDATWGFRLGPGGRAVLTNVTLKDLIMVAWHIQDFRIAGGAAWIDSERYETEGRAEGNPGEDEFRLMLQSLLAERFH